MLATFIKQDNGWQPVTNEKPAQREDVIWHPLPPAVLATEVPAEIHSKSNSKLSQ